MKDNRSNKQTPDKNVKPITKTVKQKSKPKPETFDPCLDCQQADCSQCRYWTFK